MSQLTTEQQLLGAELLCGYNYFQAQEKLAEALREDKNELANRKQQKNNALNSFPRTGDLTQIPEIVERFNQHVQQGEISDRKKFLADLTDKQEQTNIEYKHCKKQRGLYILTIVGYVLGLLILAFNIIFSSYIKSESPALYVLLYVSSGVVILLSTAIMGDVFCADDSVYRYNYANNLLVIAGRILLIVGLIHIPINFVYAIIQLIKYNKKASRIKKDLKTVTKEIDDFNNQRGAIYIRFRLSKPIRDIRLFVSNMSPNKKDQFYRRLHQEQIDQNVALAERKIQAQTLVVQNTNNIIEKLNVEGEQILQDLEIIPQYYFTKESIERMLFFFVNKRADNIKDLVNIYEQTLFQEELLKGISNLTISINKLTQAVNDGFTRLGMQLGVINNSIMENTHQMQVNRQKLNTIEDKMARNYINTVEHIHNVEKIVQEHNDYVIDDVDGQLTLKVKR